MALLYGLGLAIVIAVTGMASAGAAELVPFYSPSDGRTYLASARPERFVAPAIPQWQVDVGARYWVSIGKTQYDLFAEPPGTTFFPISRLTYKDLLAHSGEVFGRADHVTGAFIKGYVGGGLIPGGKLRDEDFPPFIVPYSSTDSEQRDGSLAYGTLDLGWSWRAERRLKLGIFAGYHHYSERLSAFGCTQIAGNPFICVPSIATSVEVIRQQTNWDAIRLGVNAEWSITNRLKLTTDAAWLPYVHLSARDTHLLRPDLVGATPQDGGGVLSMQFEAILSYAVTNALSVGVGARYWNIRSEPGAVAMHFETTTIDGGPQSATFRTERWGTFFQASYKFGNATEHILN